MATTVRVTVETGPHKGRRFCFRGRANCLVGRAPDCFMRFVGADRDLSISRHHCQLLVDPPVMRGQGGLSHPVPGRWLHAVLGML